MKKIILLILILIIIALTVFIYLAFYKHNYSKSNIPKSTQTSANQNTPTSTFSNMPSQTSSQTPAQNTFAFPIAEFTKRITKKPFGIYITAQNSPVQPEKFSGYHTGVDVEYEDVSSDTPVFAITDSTVKYAGSVSGYGGVLILETEISGNKHSVLYGHIRPANLPQVGNKFNKGEQIGVLGAGYSSETDGERKHLHFGVLSDNRIDFLGYVQNENQLSGWLNPQSLY